ncbi:predicted protein [Lichtheimia corymbifera JMRC:FSU:9682]|uniref:Uncharacterized protein n=1 Tax=Lichtheimia corymbifera JMRC:FSU:9682 TaxID=1263082 RepID=A0A068SA25_9FUNG|nr:predicted protein [Lichtheimia corymbifera JMRC:FSU:9682]
MRMMMEFNLSPWKSNLGPAAPQLETQRFSLLSFYPPTHDIPIKAGSVRIQVLLNERGSHGDIIASFSSLLFPLSPWRQQRASLVSRRGLAWRSVSAQLHYTMVSSF